MEAHNQDAMLNQSSPNYRPDTGGPAQIPDDGRMLNQEYDPTDLSGESTPGNASTLPATPTDEEEAATGNDGTSALSDNVPGHSASGPADDETMVAHDYGPTPANSEQTTTDEQRNRLAHQPYTNAVSGSSTTETDSGPSGTGEVIGNNDGTQADPERVAPATSGS